MRKRTIKENLIDKDVWVCTLLAVVVFGLAIWIGEWEHFQISETTWYYTLSTIIQSLAAILAMGGAFFIFKVPQIDKEINDYKGRMIDFLVLRENNKQSNFYKLKDKEVGERFGIALSEFVPLSNYSNEFFLPREGRSLEGEVQREALNNWLKLFNDNNDKKTDILNFLRISFRLIPAIIIFSTIFLMFSEALYQSHSLFYASLSFATWGFLVSIYYTAGAILRISGSY